MEGFVLDESSEGQDQNQHDPSSLSLEENAFSRMLTNRLVGEN